MNFIINHISKYYLEESYNGGAARLVYTANKAYHLFKAKWIAQIIKNICRIIYACDISYQIQIGKNLKMPHQGLGVVIRPDVVIGSNVTIYQNSTLGSKDNGKVYAAPVIGDHVMIGAGTVILGKVQIGSNVKIGANSVVLTDIPNNCIVAGVPAKIISKAANEKTI